MARRVFFSFHYQRDIWRVNVVRNHSIIKSGYEDSGYWDCSLWESTKKTGELALKRLINFGLQQTSVTVVLIGSETSERKWVNYEIEKSLEKGNGLLGIYVHNIKNRYGTTDFKGKNPFDNFTRTVELSNKPIHSRYYTCRLSTLVPTYDWVYDQGYNNFSKWVESAARSVGR
jgi:hypothetical protein